MMREGGGESEIEERDGAWLMARMQELWEESFISVFLLCTVRCSGALPTACLCGVHCLATEQELVDSSAWSQNWLELKGAGC